MTKKYTKIDFNVGIEAMKAEIQHDYEELCQNYSLPSELNFKVIVSAVKKGGKGMHAKSPYVKIRDQIISAISKHTKDHEELNEAVEIMTGIWNYFPHDDLSGLAPVEKIREDANGGPGGISPLAFRNMDAESYSSLIGKEVLAFSEEAADNFYKYLKKLGGTKADLKRVIDILSDPKRDPADASLYLMTHLLKSTKKKNERIPMRSLQLAMRAIMRCENYTASKMPNGHYNSRMFQYIAEQAIEQNDSAIKKAERKPKSHNTVEILEPLIVFQSLGMIYDAINDFCTDLGADIGIKEATMHIADWLAMIDVHILLTRTDLNETALHLIGAARLIAETGNPKKPYKLLDKKIRNLLKEEYGVDNDSYRSNVAQLAEEAVCGCLDPVMMMPSPGEELDDCLDRLETIAPCLKLRPSTNSFTSR